MIERQKKENRGGRMLRVAVITLMITAVLASTALSLSAEYLRTGKKYNARNQAYLTAHTAIDAIGNRLSDFDGELSQQLYSLQAGESLALGEVRGLESGMGVCTLTLHRDESGAVVEANATVGEVQTVCKAKFALRTTDLDWGVAAGFEALNLGEVSTPLDGLAATSDVHIARGEKTVSLVGTTKLPLSLTKNLYSRAPLSIEGEKGSRIRGKIISDRDIKLDGAVEVGTAAAEKSGSTAQNTDGSSMTAIRSSTGILTTGKVTLSGEVVINGDITAEEIVIDGGGGVLVNGSLYARTITIAGGSVVGDIEAEQLTVGAAGATTTLSGIEANSVVLKEDARVVLSGAGRLSAQNLEMSDFAVLSAAAPFHTEQIVADRISLTGSSALTGGATAGFLQMAESAKINGSVTAGQFSFDEGWTEKLYGDLTVGTQFPGLTRVETVPVGGGPTREEATEGGEESSSDQQPPAERPEEVVPPEENEPPAENGTQPDASKDQQSNPEERDESHPVEEGREGALSSDHITGTILLDTALTVPPVLIQLAARQTPAFPLLPAPVFPEREVLKDSVLQQAMTQEKMTIGQEHGDSYYVLETGRVSPKEVRVQGTGDIYLYIPAESTFAPEKMIFKQSNSEPAETTVLPRLFLIVEDGGSVQLPIEKGETFYGYIYGMTGSEVQVTTGGRDRRNFVGGIWLDSLSSVERGVVSGLEFTLRPTETSGLSAEEKLAFSWVFDGYQEDMEMEESAGA